MSKGAKDPGPIEVTQFRIVEKEYVVEVPKYVEIVVEVPKFVEVEYERPVIKEKEYEKPVVQEKEITRDIRFLVEQEVKRGIAEAIQSLKVAFEIPMSRVLQIKPGGKTQDVGVVDDGNLGK